MVKDRVTIRDIAEQTGLHFTTVGLALRNSPRLKASTRTKIQKLAKKLGYAPDPMVAALNAYRQTKSHPRYQATIAWINNWTNRKKMLLNYEFREYYEGATERARERGYILEEFWLKEKGMTPKIASQIFKARNIQGVLIAPQPEAQGLVPFSYEELSAVALGYSMHPAVLHVVTNHHFHTLKLMMDRLLELGYRRAGLVAGSSWDEKVDNALTGGKLLWNLKNAERISLHHFFDEIDFNEIDSENLKKWIDKERLDVIIGIEEDFHRLLSLNFEIPGDIGYVSIALRRNESYFSGVYQNDRIIGKQAIDLIIDMIHRGERGLPSVPIRTLVESTWHPGKTLRQQKNVPTCPAKMRSNFGADEAASRPHSGAT